MSKLNVLVVDDDIDFAESIADFLEMYGHDVDIANTGEEAINRYRSTDSSYDISFMDIKLPGKNGVESFLEIKSFLPDVKVVMMTGFSVEQLLELAVENGAWGILNKPLNMNELLSYIEKVSYGDVILLADNDPDFISSLKYSLEERGFHVYTAFNGKEAIEQINKHSIDVLILDLKLPILNGFEVFYELKRLKKVVPTIIISEYLFEEHDILNKFNSNYITGILSKPFDPNYLLNKIEEIIAARHNN